MGLDKYLIVKWYLGVSTGIKKTQFFNPKRKKEAETWRTKIVFGKKPKKYIIFTSSAHFFLCRCWAEWWWVIKQILQALLPTPSLGHIFFRCVFLVSRLNWIADSKEGNRTLGERVVWYATHPLAVIKPGALQFCTVTFQLLGRYVIVESVQVLRTTLSNLPTKEMKSSLEFRFVKQIHLILADVKC